MSLPTRSVEPMDLHRQSTGRRKDDSIDWTCTVCTFGGNPPLYLTCSVCCSERLQLLPVQYPTTTRMTPVAGSSSSSLKAFTSNANGKPRSFACTRAHDESLRQSSSQEYNSNDSDDSSIVVLVDPIMVARSTSTTLSHRPLKEASIQTSVKATFRDVGAGKGKSSTAVSLKRDADSSTVTSKKENCIPPTIQLNSDHTTSAIHDIPTEADTERSIDDASRRPPQHKAIVRNLSDPEYCCVWSIEFLENSYRPDVARVLLATAARHINPILRQRGWRVKRLMESCSTSWIGLCTTNDRNDADACSVNIQLNLRHLPNKQCQSFRTFSQILSVLLHEISHTSIGLEDVHPPAFWDLLNDIRNEYRTHLSNGAVSDQVRQYDDDNFYGCHQTVVVQGRAKPILDAALEFDRDHALGLKRAVALTNEHPNSLSLPVIAASDASQDNSLDAEDCGASKRRTRSRWRRRRRGTNPSRSGRRVGGTASRSRQRPPLLKGVKMVDGRTREGKAAKLAKDHCTPRELAARAALQRLGQISSSTIHPPSTEGPTQSNTTAVPGMADLTANALEISNGEGLEDDSDATFSGSDIDDDNDSIAPHCVECVCRSCLWDQTLFQPT